MSWIQSIYRSPCWYFDGPRGNRDTSGSHVTGSRSVSRSSWFMKNSQFSPKTPIARMISLRLRYFHQRKYQHQNSQLAQSFHSLTITYMLSPKTYNTEDPTGLEKPLERNILPPEVIPQKPDTEEASSDSNTQIERAVVQTIRDALSGETPPNS